MTNPLLDTTPGQIRLKNGPLERALAAVAFSPVLIINEPSGAGLAPFQERVRSVYPEIVLEHEHMIRVEAGPDGTAQPPAFTISPVWRLFDSDRNWRISLTSQSISVETQRSYNGRDDFVDRLGFLVSAIADAFAPAEMTRVGFRMLNIFGSEKLARIDEFVKPELLTFLRKDFAAFLQQSNSTNMFRVPEGTLAVKHGLLQAGMMQEFMNQPVDAAKWFLDLDVWCDLRGAFDDKVLRSTAQALTTRLCVFFHWAMTQEFLDVYSDTD